MNLEATPIDSRIESASETEKLTFHEACDQGNLKVVKVYLAHRGFDMTVRDPRGRTGFHLACDEGNLNVVQFLVKQGFDMNIGDNERATGFHWACSYGKLNVVQFLVHRGFDMNIADNDGTTGFHWACLNRNLNMVQFLVHRGCDVNISDDDGQTGFHWACSDGNLNVIQFFLQEGFDSNFINKLDDHGETGLQLLIGQRYDHDYNNLRMTCILLLIEAGAQLNKNDIFEELIPTIQNRIIEITFMKKTIFEKWTGRIAKEIVDFTMDPFTNTSLQNLSQVLD